MKLIAVILCLTLFLGISSITELIAQDTVAVDSVRRDFAGSINRMMERTKNPMAIERASAFETLWDSSTLGDENMLKVENLGKSMLQRGYSAIPFFLEYTRMLELALNTANFTTMETDSLLSVTEKVLRYESPRDYLAYLRNLNDFLEYNALYFTDKYKLFHTPGSFSIDYIEGATAVYAEVPYPEEVIQDEESEEGWGTEEDDGSATADDDGWGTTDDDGWGTSDDDGWGTTDDDDWGTTDDDWGTAAETSESSAGGWDSGDGWDDGQEALPIRQDPEALINAYSTRVIPQETGAVIRLDATDLVFVSPWDSVILKNTSGSFLINRNSFIGQGGTFDWSMAGLEPDKAYCTMDQYHFTVSRPELLADKVKLTYPEKLDESVDGIFEFRSYRRKNGQEPSYPRFISYFSNIGVQNLGDPDIIYSGGFAMSGTKITGNSIIPGTSTFEIHDETGPLLRVTSTHFEFYDSLISCKDGSISIYHGLDSIVHPSVLFRYYTNTREVVAVKNRSTNNLTPFRASHFQMGITADILAWDIDEDSLDISILNARNLVPAYFESDDYFNSDNLRNLSRIYRFNPLLMVVSYANKIQRKEFNAYELAERLNQKSDIVRASMKGLAEIGFIEYEDMGANIKVNDKAFHYATAYQHKKDFDDLLIESITTDEANATVNLEDHEMTIRGIEKFYISEILDVSIYPDSSVITLLNNRDFRFNGRLFAGNFEFAGREFLFSYDSFYVDMGQIDSIRFYIDDPETGTRRRVDNKLVSISDSEEEALAGLSSEFQDNTGRVYINRPDNKSGQKIYPTYPMFNAGKGAVVYFDGSNILDGAYDETIYFVIPPFEIDSLSDSDPSAIGFDGLFVSGGILPQFEETLHIMEDYSLGFDHEIAPEGYNLYGGTGRIFNGLKLDKNGLAGNGRIEYLTSTLESNQFTFYLDSLAGDGTRFEMKSGIHEGGSFPDAFVDNFHIHWIPRKDSMYISNLDAPVSLYEATATLDGTFTVNKAGGFGKGLLLTRGSEARSDEFNFNETRFGARHAYFEVKTDDPEKPALAGSDVKMNFNLAENYANISPEVEGIAAIEFPYAQFKTSINDARWNLDENRVIMTKPPNVPIGNSYFYATREELDSLVFNATQAVYDMRSQDLRISGIPYINVADAKITPENNEVLVLENARIGTLRNTTIVIDTLNEYHSLYNGTIDIISRNKFEGSATYQLVNAVNDTFAIKIDEFELVEEEGRGRDRILHTRARGYVEEGQEVVISPGMVYRGDAIMYAPDPAFELDGYIKLKYRENPDGDIWIKYQRTETKTEEVTFDFDNARTENGDRLTAGLHYNEDDVLYGTFINEKRSVMDRDFFIPQGLLYYDEDSSMYRIEDTLKVRGNAYAGHIFNLNVNTLDVYFEGPIYFQMESSDYEINAAAIGSGNLGTNVYGMNAFITLNFDVTPNALVSMAGDVKETTDIMGSEPAYSDDPRTLYKLAEIIGERLTLEFEKRSLQEYVPLVIMSNQLAKTIVFSDVSMQYSPEHKAWYSTGPIGIANIMRDDINSMADGFLEIKKTENGDEVNFLLQFSPDVWYYFNYAENHVITVSSNNEFNQIIADKTTVNKVGFGQYYVLNGNVGEAVSFGKRFRTDYLGIDAPFDLKSVTPVEFTPAVEDTGPTDEGFVIPEEIEKTEEEKEDDGF